MTQQSHLGMYLEKTIIQKDTCIPVFTVALFTIARTWKQPQCPSTDEWIKILWYIYLYNGILFSYKKEQNWVSCSEMNGPRFCHTEWSKSERKKQIAYIDVYIWTLEKWYWWAYLQGRNRDADVENRLVDMGEGEGEMNWESSIDICALLSVKQIASGKLLCNTGSSARRSVMAWRSMIVRVAGRLKRAGIYVYLQLIHLVIQ